MGSKDWHRMDSNDDLAAIGISPHRGRGWRILSGVLLVGTATFAAAYYLPLYRAHASLSREYRALQSQASAQHEQLTETLDTLKQISSERDKLKEIAGKLQATRSALTPQAEGLERDLQTPLKKFVGTGKMKLKRQFEKLSITLASPTFMPAVGADRCRQKGDLSYRQRSQVGGRSYRSKRLRCSDAAQEWRRLAERNVTRWKRGPAIERKLWRGREPH
jgi:hypothetical protein